MDTESAPTRIVLAEDAMVDQTVEELLYTFGGHMSRLVSSVGDPRQYQNTAEDLCRLSRRVIWSMVTSVYTNACQVDMAASQFDDAARLLEPSNGFDSTVVQGFRSAIERRATDLRSAHNEYLAHQKNGVSAWDTEDSWEAPTTDRAK